MRLVPLRGRMASLAAVIAVAFVLVACSGGDSPELVAVPPSATPAPTPTPQPEPTPSPEATPTPTPMPVPTATDVPVVASSRGVDDAVVRLGVIKSGGVFGDAELGVAARVARVNAEGGIAGRELEIVEVIDDGADPEQGVDAARRLVEEQGVFAVILASAVPVPEVTDYLEAEQVPFFGWGFAPGYCAPNEWGFGFSGCLVGAALGIEGAAPDPSARNLIEEFLQRPATVVFVTTDDVAGDAASFQAELVWGDQLLDVVRTGSDEQTNRAAIEDSLDGSDPDAVLLRVGLDEVVATKAWLLDRFDGMVVDDVSYLPGLLGDFATAEQLEGGYAVSQFPPQEEYRAVTAVVSTDLQAVGGDLIYSQAVSLGYWSTDLLVAFLDAVGSELDTASFFRTVNVEGVDYEPEPSGAPCPLNSLDIHESPAGGAALVRVTGGIYRPVVDFTCSR